MKQTAVEWLVEQLVELDKQLDGRRKNDDATVLKLNPTKLFEQAKEMEKEQMCDFVEYCQTEHSKYQETEASWIKELTIDDFFEKRYTK
jgi:hypothetical protein